MKGGGAAVSRRCRTSSACHWGPGLSASAAPPWLHDRTEAGSSIQPTPFVLWRAPCGAYHLGEGDIGAFASRGLGSRSWRPGWDRPWLSFSWGGRGWPPSGTQGRPCLPTLCREPSCRIRLLISLDPHMRRGLPDGQPVSSLA